MKTECKNQRGWETLGKHGLLHQHDWNSYEVIESEAAFIGPTQVAQDSLCIYYSFQFRGFLDFLGVWTSVSLIPVPSLGLLSFYWFVLSNFNALVFVVSYYILFYYTFILSDRSLFFSNEKQKRSRSRWNGGVEELEGVEVEDRSKHIFVRK